MNRGSRLQSLLADSARAHALRFASPLAPAYGNATGTRVLVAFVVVGIGMFVALRLAPSAAGVRGLPVANLGFVVVLLAAFVVVQRLFVAVMHGLWPPNMP